MLNDRLAALSDYPFTRLARLLEGVAPPAGVTPLVLSLGEPQHPAPALIDEALRAHAHLWNRYPPLDGTEEFREAAAGWLARRYALPPGAGGLDRCLLPVSGTREALFQAALVAVPERKHGRVPAVALPNPFYAVYEGAAVLAGAEPVFLDTGAATGFLPDLDALESRRDLLDRLALMYLCSPANPQGAVADRAYLHRLVGLARRHGFVLAVDECYAETWDREPPPGVLACADGGLDGLLVFHSLSKRSSAAGLRAGFVAGDPALIAAFRRLRGYSAAGMPLPVQAAAAALWRDDTHAAANRALYRHKIDAAERLLAGRFGFYRPPGGFFLWLDVGDGEAAARRLWAEAGLRVLPGAYLSRPAADGSDPGGRYVRVALVHDLDTVTRALERFAAVLRPAAPAAQAAGA
jgi:aspartate/methionine/tyrosine aminotransferase